MNMPRIDGASFDLLWELIHNWKETGDDSAMAVVDRHVFSMMAECAAPPAAVLEAPAGQVPVFTDEQIDAACGPVAEGSELALELRRNFIACFKRVHAMLAAAPTHSAPSSEPEQTR